MMHEMMFRGFMWGMDLWGFLLLMLMPFAIGALMFFGDKEEGRKQ